MATMFSANPDAALQLGGILTSVADELDAGATTLYSSPHTTAAPPVDAALDVYWSKSALHRTVVDGFVALAGILLRGLAERSRATDAELGGQVPTAGGGN